MSDDKFNLRWTPFFALLDKELLRFRRVITQTLVVPLVNTTLYLMIFGVSLGKGISLSNGMLACLGLSDPGSRDDGRSQQFVSKQLEPPLPPRAFTATSRICGWFRSALFKLSRHSEWEAWPGES